jgi:hypothetical protein
MAALPFAKLPIDSSFTSKARRGAPCITYGAINYYHVLGLPFPFRYLKVLQPDTVRYVEISGPEQVSPHRDHTTVTALNCYFQAGGAITHFWNLKAGAEAIRFPGASTSNIFKNFDDLDPIASFTAQDGDTYLLDVSTVHSVERVEPLQDRRFIQLSWRKTNFDTVLARCQQAFELPPP